ncbi:unnamed protein product [marine sediment metagenome]|uniref:Uncharacterized protein n=1 Tax=marine sediment metagenome TaxID=412755 RepID=X0TEK4_9ZZZZ
MQRSRQHERLKSREQGRKEKPTTHGRFDASTRIKVIEIERTGSPQRLRHAIQKLKKSTKPQKILRVPQHDMDKATDIAKELRAKLTITNLSKTKRKSIKR